MAGQRCQVPDEWFHFPANFLEYEIYGSTSESVNICTPRTLAHVQNELIYSFHYL
jgi:hypothetical protein